MKRIISEHSNSGQYAHDLQGRAYLLALSHIFAPSLCSRYVGVVGALPNAQFRPKAVFRL
jgi:hypothetical protein